MVCPQQGEGGETVCPQVLWLGTGSKRIFRMILRGFGGHGPMASVVHGLSVPHVTSRTEAGEWALAFHRPCLIITMLSTLEAELAWSVWLGTQRPVPSPERRARLSEWRRKRRPEDKSLLLKSEALPTFYNLDALMGWLSGRNRKLVLKTMNSF